MNENAIISFKPKPLWQDSEKMETLLVKKNLINKKRPILEDFGDIYTKEEIANDKRKIQEREAGWNLEDKKEKFVRDFSSIYEAAIIDILDKNKFLGEDNEIIPTCKFDDIFNGIDSVLIIKNLEQNQHLGLNIDVTLSSNPEFLEKKIESIRQCIRRGVLPTLKYFQDPTTKKHEKVSLPKIIVGSQQSSADGLVRLWGQSNENNNEKLKNHPIQSKIIMEAIMQLSYFSKFAQNLSENTREANMKEKYIDIYIKYGEMFNYFVGIYNSKISLIQSHYNDVKSDTVYKNMEKITKIVL